jgi:hypothetical protein
MRTSGKCSWVGFPHNIVVVHYGMTGHTSPALPALHVIVIPTIVQCDMSISEVLSASASPVLTYSLQWLYAIDVKLVKQRTTMVARE